MGKVEGKIKGREWEKEVKGTPASAPVDPPVTE